MADSFAAWAVYHALKQQESHSPADVQGYIDTLASIEPSMGADEVAGIAACIATLEELASTALGDGYITQAEALVALPALYYL